MRTKTEEEEEKERKRVLEEKAKKEGAREGVAGDQLSCHARRGAQRG